MPRSPVRDGWRVLRRAPAVALIEIAWRWTFGVALCAVLYYSFRPYFGLIEIRPAEYTLLRSLDLGTWMTVSARVVVALTTWLRDTGPLVIPALAILWIALGTIGRAATIRALAADIPRTSWTGTAGIFALRVLLSAASLLAFFSSGIVIGKFVGDPAQHLALAFLLSAAVLVFLAMLWTLLNWVLSLAVIFTTRDGAGFFRSLRYAAELYHQRTDEYLRAGFAFGVIRTVLVIAATVLSLMPLTRGGAIRPAVVAAVLISIAYFAVADALNMWRLAAYVALSEPERGEIASAAAAVDAAPAAES